ncbi:MAG: ABC transporter ATP-binding protein [Gammaproteobacteria bacterium]|nr:ABC transporter ATP-binding protein [Gammaproteobacteria bacterium]
MINVENLTKDYGGYRALDDISFSVEKGEILGFLGPNGAGKTTTMRILTCYSPPTKGKVMVAGYDCFEDSLNVRRKIGYLPERVPLYEDMRVDEYLIFVAKIKGMSSRDTKHKVSQIMGDCGLGDVSKKMISSISRGYRQRVGIAQALVNDPEVLVLDEPTVGLDPKQIKEIRNLIKELAGKHTVILSTHILPEVSLLCSRVIIINEGKLIAVDTPENLTSGSVSRMFLRISGDVVKVEKALSSLTEIKGVERELTTAKDACGFIVTFDNEKKARKSVHSVIDTNGWDLIEMRPMEMSLEDVFIKLVTKEST